MSERKMFRSMAAFYSDDRSRHRSAEADYGCHWRVAGFPRPWRVSYVQNTGEIYAVHTELSMVDEAEMLLAYGPVLVLGVVPPDPVIHCAKDVFYCTLDRILDGWADVATGTPFERDTLRWVADRLHQEET